jgi:hypothetical protein
MKGWAAHAMNGELHPTSSALKRSVEGYFELSLFAMVAVAFMTLAGTGKLDPVSLLFVVTGLGIRAYLLATRRNFQLSLKTTNRLTVFYFFFYPLDFLVISRSFVDATIHLVLFLLVAKVFSVHRDRDRIYLAAISFMMVLSSAILTVDSFFIATFSVFLLLTVTTFTSMEMRRSFQAATTAGNDADSEEAALHGVVGVISGQTAPRRMQQTLSTVAIVLVVAILVSAAGIFFILPRVSTNYLRSLAARNDFASGFSDNVKLGEIGRIQLSDAIVFHAKFVNPSAVPSDLKWRGTALGQFDGYEWTKSPVESSEDLTISGAEVQKRMFGDVIHPGQFRQMEYHVTMQPIGTNYFFVPPVLYMLHTDTTQLQVDHAGSIGRHDAFRQIRTYDGGSWWVTPSRAELERGGDVPEQVRRIYLTLPQVDPRIPELAGRVTATGKTPFEKAFLLERHLQTSYGYTLEMAVSPDPKVKPLSFFLFTRKKGHCEYFASAMAIMLRTQGIPSRIVNGFRNGEYNDISGSFVVRAANAHSWVEAYIGGYGWVTFDPTPSADVPARTVWARLGMYAEAMREFWSEWIVNYDTFHQATLAEGAITRSRNQYQNIRNWFSRFYERMLTQTRSVQKRFAHSPVQFSLRVLALVAGLLLLIRFPAFVRWVRSVHLRRSPSAAPRESASLWYARLIKLLARRGYEKQPTQTAQEHLCSLERNLRVQRSVKTFVEHYERARFGASTEDAEKLSTAYDDVETILSGKNSR